MPTRISAANIQPGAITADRLAEGAGGGPKITNAQVTDSGYNVIDDTAVSLSGGYLKITGTGFQTGCVAIIGNTPAVSTSFISSNFLNVQVGAAAAGTYILYVVNPDGGVAIRINAVTYSQTPSWITGSTLPEIVVDDQISIQLSASSNSSVVYSLESGSVLPPGISLSSNGLLTGSITGLVSDTLYSFTVVATDTENQDSPRAFSITVVIGDPFFRSNVLLLNGDGVNAANNNTFLDSSTNNFTITRNGNTTQGTFSPFSSPDGRWSGYFDGTGDWLTVTDNAAFDLGSGAFTIEGWFNPSALLDASILDTRYGSVSPFPGYLISPRSDGTMQVASENTNLLIGTIATPLNQWSHFAVVRDGSSNLSLFINGVRDVTTSSSTVFNSAGNPIIGAKSLSTSGLVPINGYLSNLRIVKNSAVYDPTLSTLTVPAIPLTAITNTSLLTCQSNRFKDNSTNNFTITPSGNVSVTSFAPFAPTGVYSAATNGGSGYFDGSGDSLTVSGSTVSFGTNAYTIEFWIYRTAAPGLSRLLERGINSTDFSMDLSSAGVLTINNNSTIAGSTCTTSIPLNTWTYITLVRTSTSASSTAWYINGVASGTFTHNTNVASGGTLSITTGGLTGYLSNLRIIQGTAVYPSAFTPPTAPLSAIANTQLLCNFTNAAIIDYTGKNNLETVNGVQIATSEKKYGTGSILFDGIDDYVISPSNPNYNFPGDFTIECWLRILNITDTVYYRIASRGAFQSGTNDWIFVCRPSERAVFFQWGNPNTTIGVLNVLSANTWHHVAVSRQGSTLRIFIDGVIGNSGTVSNNFTNTRPFAIGTNSSSPSEYFKGYIDDFRITKDIARYTANFTPPASALRLR